jgi:hypothetical protein
MDVHGGYTTGTVGLHHRYHPSLGTGGPRTRVLKPGREIGHQCN